MVIITSFGLVAIDLGQQPNKAHQIAGGVSGVSQAHREATQVANLHGQGIFERWFASRHGN
jgi:hypothetical protein